MSLLRSVATMTLAVGVLSACAAGPETRSARELWARPAASAASSYPRQDSQPPGSEETAVSRLDSSQAAPFDPSRSAAYAAVVLIPSRLLDAAILAVTSVILTRQSEHEDDFISNFGRRVFNGRSPI